MTHVQGLYISYSRNKLLVTKQRVQIRDTTARSKLRGSVQLSPRVLSAKAVPLTMIAWGVELSAGWNSQYYTVCSQLKLLRWRDETRP